MSYLIRSIKLDLLITLIYTLSWNILLNMCAQFPHMNFLLLFNFNRSRVYWFFGEGEGGGARTFRPPYFFGNWADTFLHTRNFDRFRYPHQVSAVWCNLIFSYTWDFVMRSSFYSLKIFLYIEQLCTCSNTNIDWLHVWLCCFKFLYH